MPTGVPGRKGPDAGGKRALRKLSARKEKPMSVLPAILVAVALAVAGQLLVKHGIRLLPGPYFASGLLSGFLRIFTSPWVLVGSGLYTLSVFFWVFALTTADLSFAYPFVSLSYVLIILASRFLLGETVSLIRWIGAFVICCGIVLLSLS